MVDDIIIVIELNDVWWLIPGVSIPKLPKFALFRFVGDWLLRRVIILPVKG
jgi:hypothetical protein